ncbi:unnamed protein product, partial [Larinioides sclopetarius]
MEVLEQVNYSDSDLRDIWDTESFSSVHSIPYDETILKHLAEDMNLDTEADWAQILDNQPIVLNDRMMTDAVQSPHIQSEHSYSLTLNDEMPQSPFGHNIKLEDYSKEFSYQGRMVFPLYKPCLFSTQVWIWNKKQEVGCSRYFLKTFI